jgi:hypothetical protein
MECSSSPLSLGTGSTSTETSLLHRAHPDASERQRIGDSAGGSTQSLLYERLNGWGVPVRAVSGGWWVPTWSRSGVSTAVGSCRYDSSGDGVAGDVPFGAVYESVVMATQHDEVVEFGFPIVSVASFTELFVPHNLP